VIVHCGTIGGDLFSLAASIYAKIHNADEFWLHSASLQQYITISFIHQKASSLQAACKAKILAVS
jgi:hypothetical protein